MSRQPVFEYHPESIIIPVNLPDGNKKNISIESGYAFGTGGHFTTRLCLTMIEDLFSHAAVKTVLDVGCGSAILAIATIALGARSAVAIDIQPTVIGEARKNVDVNGYSSKIQVINTDIVSINESYDLVIANILTEQILNIKSSLVSRLNDNSRLILSGIRLNEKDSIIDSFTKLNINYNKILTEDDWCSILFSNI